MVTPHGNQVIDHGKADKSIVANLNPLLFNQHTLGNRAVQRMIGRSLKSNPGDVYPREADRLVDTVMRRTGSENETTENKVENPGQQRQSGGRSVAHRIRAFMESRYDFDSIRPHTDNWTREAVHTLRGRAFSRGHQSRHGMGRDSSRNVQGYSLLARELSQVIHRAQYGPQNMPDILRWDLAGTQAVLCADPAGRQAVNVLGGYSVYSYDTYTYMRQYYTDATKTVKKGAPRKHTRYGYHRRSAREIGFMRKFTNNEAASTLVHESVHARQHEAYEKRLKINPAAAPPTTKEKEYEAHIRQEEFNLRNKIPPKKASFRKKVKVGAKWVEQLNIKEIKKHVNQVYGIGPKKFFDNYNWVGPTNKKLVGPWSCKKVP